MRLNFCIKCIIHSVYLKNKIQYLSDRNPYSLRNVASEKLQIPKAKTDLFKKTFTYSEPKVSFHNNNNNNNNNKFFIY
jgi:hypothetical protein